MKSRIIHLGVFLLLGAIVTVAVAWRAALWSRITYGTVTLVDSKASAEFEDDWGDLWIGRPTGSAQVAWIGRGAACDAIGFAAGDQPFYRQTTLPDQTLDVSVQADVLISRLIALRSGWPLRAFSGACVIDNVQFMTPPALLGDWQTPTRPATTIGARVVDMPVERGFTAFRLLPLRPIWSGFAINTLFYAVILWLLFAAPFALRRWRRIRRGLCSMCAYPIGDSPVCTECGEPVPRRCGTYTASMPTHTCAFLVWSAGLVAALTPQGCSLHGPGAHDVTRKPEFWGGARPNDVFRIQQTVFLMDYQRRKELSLVAPNELLTLEQYCTNPSAYQLNPTGPKVISLIGAGTEIRVRRLLRREDIKGRSDVGVYARIINGLFADREVDCTALFGMESNRSGQPDATYLLWTGSRPP